MNEELKKFYTEKSANILKQSEEKYRKLLLY